MNCFVEFGSGTSGMDLCLALAGGTNGNQLNWGDSETFASKAKKNFQFSLREFKQDETGNLSGCEGSSQLLHVTFLPNARSSFKQFCREINLHIEKLKEASQP